MPLHRSHPLPFRFLVFALLALPACARDLPLEPDARTTAALDLTGPGLLAIVVDDPIGDPSFSFDIDVTRMVLRFDPLTGAYEIAFTTTPEQPFLGEFRINVNLFDIDADVFFGDVLNDFDLATPTTSLTLEGTSAALTAWRAGDRVHTNSLAGTPNPPGASLYRTSVIRFSDGEDVIAFADLAKPAIVQADAFSCADVTSVPPSECEALVAFHEQTAGDAWTIRTGWLHDPDPCAWYGVGCDAGMVTSLRLPDNDLSGPLPAGLAGLGGLRDLDLSLNALTGAVPAELGTLQQLEQLGLFGNALTGEIPEALGTLARLGYLNLGGNQLSGAIPSALGSLGNLDQLNLGQNALTGPIPAELGNLAKLESLILQHNALAGPVPASLGDLANLQTLALNSNDLSGEIPAELGALSALLVLDLGFNRLDGLVPLPVATIAAAVEAQDGAPCRLTPNAGLFMPDVAAYRALDGDDDGRICGVVLTGDASVLGADLVDTIADLHAAGAINGGQANALWVKIDQALALSARGSTRGAVAVLRGLIAQVGDLVADGVLTADQGAALTERVGYLIGLVEGSG